MPYSSVKIIEPTRQVQLLPLEQLSPRPTCAMRQEDSSTLEELAEAIRAQGLVRPIVVQRTGENRYTVVSGNRRLMACRMLGFREIEAVLLWPDLQCVSARQIMQSLVSGRLHYVEQARALYALNTVCGVSREQLARHLDMPPAAVTALMRLTELEGELQVCLMEENLPEPVAQALLKLPDASSRMRIACQAAEEKLSVREVEALVSSAVTRLAGRTGYTICRMRDHRIYLNALRSIVEQMQEAGLEVSFTQRQLSGRVEVAITMSTRKRRSQR